MSSIDHNDLLRLLGGPAAVAKRLRIKTPSVYNWIDGAGNVRIPDARLIELGAAIEKASGGRLTRQQLRPDDWQAIWPELAQPSKTEAAP